MFGIASIFLSRPMLIAYAVVAALGTSFMTGVNWQAKRDNIVALRAQAAARDLQIEILQKDVDIAKAAEADAQARASKLASNDASTVGIANDVRKTSGPLDSRCNLTPAGAGGLQRIR